MKFMDNTIISYSTLDYMALVLLTITKPNKKAFKIL